MISRKKMILLLLTALGVVTNDIQAVKFPSEQSERRKTAAQQLQTERRKKNGCSFSNKPESTTRIKLIPDEEGNLRSIGNRSVFLTAKQAKKIRKNSIIKKLELAILDCMRVLISTSKECLLSPDTTKTMDSMVLACDSAKTGKELIAIFEKSTDTGSLSDEIYTIIKAVLMVKKASFAIKRLSLSPKELASFQQTLDNKIDAISQRICHMSFNEYMIDLEKKAQQSEREDVVTNLFGGMGI